MNMFSYIWGSMTYFPMLLAVLSLALLVAISSIFYFLHRGESLKSRLTGFNLFTNISISFVAAVILSLIPVVIYGITIEDSSMAYVKTETGRENPIIKVDNNFKDKNIQWTIFTGDADNKNEYTDKNFFKVLTTDDKTKKVVSVSESSQTIEELNEYLDSTLGKPLK